MTCDAVAAALTVENLSWGPSTRLPIIHGISFNVKAGERIAIIGPNGAGKSSLLRCLYRVNRPLHGTVRIDGDDIWSMPAQAVARRVAAVLQEMPSDFPFTVSDIVRTGRIPHQKLFFADHEAEARKVSHALEHLGLTGMSQRHFASLSGGEKQRVVIARALAQGPAILILDEPTNHLDIRHQLEILQSLQQLGITVITTLHDINHAASFADRVAIISGGKLTAFGRPGAVLTNSAIGEAFSVQANRYTVSVRPGPHFFFSLPRTTQQENQQ